MISKLKLFFAFGMFPLDSSIDSTFLILMSLLLMFSHSGIPDGKMGLDCLLRWPQGLRTAGPWPGKIRDRQCRPARLQLGSCPVLLGKQLLILGRFYLCLLLSMEQGQDYIALCRRDTGSLHLAWALGQRCEEIPKVPTHCHPTLQGPTLGPWVCGLERPNTDSTGKAWLV